MAGEQTGNQERIPKEIRDASADLYDDVVMLHLKWRFYLELFCEPGNAQLLSKQSRAFFQIVEESLRADMLMALCRLSDPSPSLARESFVRDFPRNVRRSTQG